MRSIAQRVEYRANIVADLVRQWHHVERGQAQVLCKGPLLVYSDSARGRIKVELART